MSPVFGRDRGSILSMPLLSIPLIRENTIDLGFSEKFDTSFDVQYFRIDSIKDETTSTLIFLIRALILFSIHFSQGNTKLTFGLLTENSELNFRLQVRLEDLFAKRILTCALRSVSLFFSLLNLR